jgi:pyruvate/2-oxoglutarate dehydrogenase complex dihydrolipoamide acyltransferase (E2) component
VTRHMRVSLRATTFVLVLSATFGGTLPAQSSAHRTHDHTAAKDTAAGGAEHADTAFAALQARGKAAMGVDQYTSTHRFDVLPDGGRIELQRDSDDPAGVAQIRKHMREIAGAFAAGHFDIPMLVHMQEVPGTRVMKERARMIQYTVRDLPRGAEVRLTTVDPEALAAIREFMAFQRRDHRTGGAGGEH